ncbi:hypothetical protein EJ110_NYTH09527 [Nymphaea thermarum]|nr:hypothetical protein EJ110_NYTH09527 [Nymphaea thermarum]
MAEGGDDLIDLAAETSPVPQRKLRRLKRSGAPDLEPKVPVSKTLDFGNPEGKEITGFSRSPLLDGFGSDGFRPAEVAVLGNLAEEVGGFEETGSVSGLPDEGEQGVENFGDGAFYRGNDGEDRPMEVLGQDADGRQGDRAEERNEASEDDGESSGDDGEEERAVASENGGEDSPDNGGEEHMEDFTSAAYFSSRCEGEVQGELREDRIFTNSADSVHLKTKRRRGSEGEGKTKKRGRNNKVGSNDERASISASNKRKLEKKGLSAATSCGIPETPSRSSISIIVSRLLVSVMHMIFQIIYCSLILFSLLGEQFSETRDASFKPVVGVKKPVSSLLEKMRQRKLELMRRNAELFSVSDDITGADKPEKDTNVDEENFNAAGIKQDLIEEEKADPDVDRIRCEADHLVNDESLLPSSAGNACGGTAANAVSIIGCDFFYSKCYLLLFHLNDLRITQLSGDSAPSEAIV